MAACAASEAPETVPFTGINTGELESAQLDSTWAELLDAHPIFEALLTYKNKEHRILPQRCYYCLFFSLLIRFCQLPRDFYQRCNILQGSFALVLSWDRWLINRVRTWEYRAHKVRSCHWATRPPATHKQLVCALFSVGHESCALKSAALNQTKFPSLDRWGRLAPRSSVSHPVVRCFVGQRVAPLRSLTRLASSRSLTGLLACSTRSLA